MKLAKSEPKIKFSLKKIENFIEEKNWKDPMYMDSEPNSQRKDLHTRIKSQSHSSLPKNKLSLTLNEKVNKVMGDSRKVGMLSNKSMNASVKKSQAKISYTSTLPPIKTEVQETSQFLNRIKKQFNDVCLGNIRFEKEINSMQASRKQMQKKIRMYEDILYDTKKEEIEEINSINSMTSNQKYQQSVRTHMRDSLKKVLLSLSAQKKNLQKRLQKIKCECKMLDVELNKKETMVNDGAVTKSKYSKEQNKNSQQFQMKSNIAKAKISHEHRAEKLHQQLQNIESYDQNKFDYETNLKNHYARMKEVRVQQFLSRMIGTLLQKYQLECKDLQRCYGLIKMYSILNCHDDREGPRIVQKPKKKDDVQEISGTANIAQLYQQCFQNKKQLEEKIRVKQEKLANVKQRNKQLFEKWVEKTYEDSVTKGDKMIKKKTDFSKQTKALYRREEECERMKKTMLEIRMWIKKQNEKLNIKGSKKSTATQFFENIIKQVKEEWKKIEEKNDQTNKKVNK